MKIRLAITSALSLGVFAAASAPIYDVVAYDEIAANPDAYLTGGRALIIRGAALGWDAVTRLSPAFLLNATRGLEETNIADWYPESMGRASVHPYLVNSEEGMRLLSEAGSAGREAYLQWRLPLDQAERLLAAMSPFPAFLRSVSPDAWMPSCLPTRAARNNFMMVVAWYMLVIGVPGGGMFFHPDNYDSGTWQAQLVGTKEWMLCDPGRVGPGQTLGAAGDFDTFAKGFELGKRSHNGPYARFPHQACARITAQPGDVLVYPSRWWHQTRVPAQEDLPAGHPNHKLSFGLAGRWVNRVNYAEIAAAVEAKCRSNAPDISLQFKGAAPNPSAEVCELVRSKCMKAWSKQFAGAATSAAAASAAGSSAAGSKLKS